MRTFRERGQIKLTIIFPTVVSRSGSDVYFMLLARALPPQGITAKQILFSHRHEFIPLISSSERRAIRAGDILHTAVEYGALVHIRGKPLILTALHNVMNPKYQRYTNPLQKICHRVFVHPRQARSLRLADVVICISEATRRSYVASYPGYEAKMTVIYPGLDLHRFSPGGERLEVRGQKSEIPGPSPVASILFVGHKTRRKGADLLPRIMDRLGPGHELICVGQRNAQAEESTTPSGARIRILSPVSPDELAALYRNCKLLLFPSRLEGFGYAVAEAMACGKPVVATDGSSIPELIDHGQGGLLCPMDDTEAFAEAVQQILADPEQSAAMGIYNRAKAERMFSLERMVKEHVAVYRELVG